MRPGATPLVWLLVAVSGCDPQGPCEHCLLQDRHNFSYASTLQVASLPLAEGRDAVVRWDQLTTDLRGRPMEPSVEPGEALLVLFPQATAQQVQDAIATDSLRQDDVGGYFLCTPEQPACSLSEFCLSHTCLDPWSYFQASRGTWMVALREVSSQEALSFLFLEPSGDSESEEARFEDGATQLSLEVDLESMEPLVVDEGLGVELDWGGLTVDGLGNPLALHQLDRLELARYPASLSELERDFLLLENLEAQRWSLDVEGRLSVGLEELEGEGLEGVDGEGTWLLALRCSTCLNPVPRVIVRLLDEAAL